MRARRCGGGVRRGGLEGGRTWKRQAGIHSWRRGIMACLRGRVFLREGCCAFLVGVGAWEKRGAADASRGGAG